MKKNSILILVIAILSVFGCGKDEQKDQKIESLPAITDMTSITGTADKRTLVGRKVDIPNAPAQQVVGTYIFWAGDPHSAVPVVRGDKLKGPVREHVRAGERVRITGTVRLLEGVAAADPMWDHVNENERRDIIAANVFIQADEISVIHSLSEE